MVVRRSRRHEQRATALRETFAVIALLFGVMKIPAVQHTTFDVKISGHHETFLGAGMMMRRETRTGREFVKFH